MLPVFGIEMEQPPLVTLLSDFGSSDVYVGVMKGVIAQINPNLRVIDLTHEIEPQNIAAARFCLMNAVPYFPEGSVHIAVVDPGVGGIRRAIALQIALEIGLQSFHAFLTGPDNGIFSGVVSQSQVIAAVELTNSQYWRTPEVSRTFHGRDIFAPVAAHLACGVPLKQLGTEIDAASLVNLDIAQCRQTETGAVGFVQYIDHFGNLVSNISRSYVQNKTWDVKVGELTIPGCETYADVQVGEVVALVGSHGWVEIAINSGNAQIELQIQLADVVEVCF